MDNSNPTLFCTCQTPDAELKDKYVGNIAILEIFVPTKREHKSLSAALILQAFYEIP